MADRHTKEQRSYNMRAVRSSNTGPEVFLRKQLFAAGLRYTICDRKITGKPDLFFSRYKAAVFVHGCFWHRHSGCAKASVPATGTEFWTKKFADNVRRDAEVKKALSEQGIRVAVVWECAVKRMQKDKTYAEEVTDRLKTFIQGSEKRAGNRLKGTPHQFF